MNKKYVRIEEIPGRGRGLVAAEDIPAGALLLKDLGYTGATSEAVAKLLIENVPDWNKYCGASDPAKNDVERAMNVLKKNSFGGVEETGCFFPNVSLLNHSCLPNASFPPRGPQRSPCGRPLLSVVCIRGIPKGEEITICYLQLLGPTPLRQSLLQKVYGFECNCERCAAGPSIAEQEVYAPLEDAGQKKRFQELLAMHDKVRALKDGKETMREIRSFLQTLPEECFARFQLTMRLHAYSELSRIITADEIRNSFKDAAAWVAERYIRLLPEKLENHAFHCEVYFPLFKFSKDYPSTWEGEHGMLMRDWLYELKRLTDFYKEAVEQSID